MNTSNDLLLICFAETNKSINLWWLCSGPMTYVMLGIKLDDR